VALEEDGTEKLDQDVRSAVGRGVVMDIPQLEGWMTLPEAGRMLGLSRGGMYHLVFVIQPFDFKNEMRATLPPERVSAGEKTIYFISTEALQREYIRRFGHRFGSE
jgi:hypothetical protein